MREVEVDNYWLLEKSKASYSICHLTFEAFDYNLVKPVSIKINVIVPVRRPCLLHQVVSGRRRS